MNPGMIRSRKYLLIAALVLLLGSNVFVLTGVAYNRSDEPLSVITLTERELSLPYSYHRNADDSGVQFRLQWRVFSDKEQYSSYGYYSGQYTTVAWLDEKKLQQLGFDTSYQLDKKDSYRVYRNMPEKEVFLVLEYDGEAYQHSLQQVQNRLFEKEAALEGMFGDEKKRLLSQLKDVRKRLELEQNSYPRLFVIDAGNDALQLRRQYAGKNSYLVLKGKVRISLDTINQKKSLRGRITGLSNDQVHVPLPFKPQLSVITQGKEFRSYQADTPRFTTKLAWGKRYEPWIVSVDGID